jgi:hypothetical protein
MKSHTKAMFMSLMMVLVAFSVLAAPTGDGLQTPPVADPNGPYEAYVGEVILLDGSGSFDPDGDPIIMYTWESGDGWIYEESELVAPDGLFDGMTQYAYPAPGDYYVVLTVTDASGDVGLGETTAKIIEEPWDTEVLIDFRPDTLNVGSGGRWVSVLIVLPEPFEAVGIDIIWVEMHVLSSTMSPDNEAPIVVEDHELDVKFQRHELCEIVLDEGINDGLIEVQITGMHDLLGLFGGSDTVGITAPKVLGHERLADGTHHWSYSSGLEYWKYPNGTEFWSHPDGTLHWIYSDGSELWIHPDGTKHWEFPDGDEVWVYTNGTRHWIRTDGVEVWILPADIQKILDLIGVGRFQDAIDETLLVFRISKVVRGRLANGTAVAKTAIIVYNASVEGDGETYRCGLVRIGPDAFTRSAGWLASTIQHELVHVKQDVENRWYEGDQGWAMNEVEAYDHEIKNAYKKGLNEGERMELIQRRNNWYNQLNKHNKKRADNGLYSLPPGEEDT